MNSSEQLHSEIKVAESQIHHLESQFSQQWSNLQSSLKKIQSSLQIRTKELESKEQRLNLLQKSLEYRQKEVELREKQFNSFERFVCDRCKTLGIKVSETGNVVVKIEPSIEFEDDYCKNDASIKLFVTMDGRALQMFLNDRVDEHDLISEEVKSAIKLSSDPAKLVLDAMEGFFPPHLRKGDLEYKGIVARSSCVLLLEQLIELKPRIKMAVREEARVVARDWIVEVRAERGSYMMVLGFLLLVVVYSVWSEFDMDELRSFCDVVQQHRLAVQLRSKLGFLRKCGMSTMGSQFQTEEPYTPPVKNLYFSEEEQPYSASVKNVSVSLDEPSTPPVKNVFVSQKETYTPPVKNVFFSQEVSYTPAKNVSVSKEEQFSPPVKNISVSKKESYTPAKNVSVSKEEQFTSPVKNISASKKQSYTLPVKNVSFSTSNNSSADLSILCEEMNATALKSYLIKNIKDLKLIDEKVLDCIRYASDPAKLVFKVVQEFYLELDETKGETYMSCCTFLLEQMMKLSAHISFRLKEETINFAACWKARLAKESTKPFLVLGFLKFLAAYKLSSSFQAEEILSLFTMFYERDDMYESELNPGLCRALGLEARIPDLIQTLIKKNKQLAAVRYICAFNLADNFPPGPLLKEYLEQTKAAAMEKCKNSNETIKVQNEGETKQIRALQNVIRCIFDFKIDSEFSPIDLQQRIRQLEKEKEEKKSEKKKTGKKKRSSTQSDSKGMKKQAVAGSTTTPNFVSPNVSHSVTSNINTFNQPSSNFQQHSFHDTNYGMSHNLHTRQLGVPVTPYPSHRPIVYPIAVSPKVPSFPSDTSLILGTPTSAGYNANDFRPSS